MPSTPLELGFQEQQLSTWIQNVLSVKRFALMIQDFEHAIPENAVLLKNILKECLCWHSFYMLTVMVSTDSLAKNPLSGWD